MDRKLHWEQVYAQKQPTEVSWFQPRPEYSLRLIAASGVDKSQPIIDMGGGASRGWWMSFPSWHASRRRTLPCASPMSAWGCY